LARQLAGKTKIEISLRRTGLQSQELSKAMDSLSRIAPSHGGIALREKRVGAAILGERGGAAERKSERNLYQPRGKTEHASKHIR
jgi:hypothetical protein